MADWPDTDELAKVLDVDPDGGDWNTTLDRIMASAIRKVQHDCGLADSDDPTDSQAAAALRMGELMAQRPDVHQGVGLTERVVILLSHDAAYQAHIQGSRQRFGIG